MAEKVCWWAPRPASRTVAPLSCYASVKKTPVSKNLLRQCQKVKP